MTQRLLQIIEVETPAWEITSPMGPDVTWRFCEQTNYFPKSIDAIPSLQGVSFSPAVISLGENLGTRAAVTATFRDHRHIMGTDAFDSGTFWGKWRARYGQRLRGRPFRLIRGILGQTLAEMETWHFVVESVDGPTPDGAYSIKAQDVLKLVDDKRALAPRPTNGFLVSPIDSDDTAAVLGPSGIGNLQYSASGYVNIGGKEVCAFTRSGDNLTLTRNTTIPGFTFETEVSDHAAGARVQLCLPFIADDPADILNTLYTTYAGVDPSYIPLATWQDETGEHLQTVYTTLITEPTGVGKLGSELMQQAALANWWDALLAELKLQVLRPISTTAAVFDQDSWLERSLRVQDQPNTRLSEVLVYYGLRNPLKSIDDADNYRSALLVTDLDAETDYGGIANKTIKSRWIPFGAGTVAQRLGHILLGRFVDPPRRFSFDTWRFAPDVPALGGGYRLGWVNNQNVDGTPALAPIQITKLGPLPEKYQVEAEEMLFTFQDEVDLTNRVVTIDSAINNINLRDLHDNIFPELTADDLSASPPTTVTFIVAENVIVGSTNTANPACDVGDWLMGFTPSLRLNGRIQGRGGKGGPRNNNNPPVGSNWFGFDGGVALFARDNIDVEYGPNGEIWGGAGGGGGFAFTIDGVPKPVGGGGGAGQLPGDVGTTDPVFDEGTPGTPGTTEAGGSGDNLNITVSGDQVDTGDGGDPGQNGDPGTIDGVPPSYSQGGQAGAAIDGVSFVNVVAGVGDVRGPTIN